MTTRCLRCGSPTQGVAQYCLVCQEQLRQEGPLTAATSTLSCSSCGSALSTGARFCQNCGTQLTGFVYAGFWIRLLASFVDTLILGAAGLTISVLATDLTLAPLFGVLIDPIYVIGLWSTSGATLGKKFLGHRVVKASGDPLGFGDAFLRYLGYFVSSISFGIGYLMIAFRSDKRGLHDLIAGTVVIKSR